MKREQLTILDVAAGTGLVGEELKKAGFKVDNVTALDFSPEMLEVSRKKGVYGKLVESAFNTTIPEGLKARATTVSSCVAALLRDMCLWPVFTPWQGSVKRGAFSSTP